MSANVATQLNTYRSQALDSLLSQDYVGARAKANACLLIIATIPDGSLGGLSSQSWDRAGIVLFLEQLDRLESAADTAASGGMLIQGYEYSGLRGGTC